MTIPNKNEEFKKDFQIRTEEMFYSLLPTISKYKKPQKVELAKLLENSLINAIGYMNMAIYIPSLKKQYLKQAQAEIENSRFIIKSMRKIEVISAGFWRNLDSECTIISKLMGAYLKKIK